MGGMFLGAWLNLCEPRAVVAEITVYPLQTHSPTPQCVAVIERCQCSQKFLIPATCASKCVHLTSSPQRDVSGSEVCHFSAEAFKKLVGPPQALPVSTGGNKGLRGPRGWLDHKMEGTWVPIQHAKESHLSPRNTYVGHLSE